MGGGGGAAGDVDYPDYMKEVHGDWLDLDGSDQITNSVTGLMNAGFGNSPFTGVLAADPDAYLTAMLAGVATFEGIVGLLAELTDWPTLVALSQTTLDAIIDADARIAAATAAHGAVLDDRLNSEVLPRFRAGMRDINAVMSSSFVIGQAVIEGMQTHDVAKFDAGLRMASYQQRNDILMKGIDQLIQLEGTRLQYWDAVTRYTIEANRMAIVAKKEEADDQREIDEKDALWDLELFKYGCNVLSAIGGASVVPKQQSKVQSAIGGALSGAAAGMALTGGNPIGGAIGGLLGLGAGLF